MTKSPRLQQIEAMLEIEPNDEFLRYGQAMEYTSAGDDETAAKLLRELIALGGAQPYIPAFLMAGQAYNRLGELERAAEVLKAGIQAARKVQDHHAAGEMQSLLATVE